MTIFISRHCVYFVCLSKKFSPPGLCFLSLVHYNIILIIVSHLGLLVVRFIFVSQYMRELYVGSLVRFQAFSLRTRVRSGFCYMYEGPLGLFSMDKQISVHEKMYKRSFKKIIDLFKLCVW